MDVTVITLEGVSRRAPHEGVRPREGRQPCTPRRGAPQEGIDKENQHQDYFTPVDVAACLMESNADIEEPELPFPGPLCGPVTQNFFGETMDVLKDHALSPKQWLFCYLERVISPWRNSLAEPRTERFTRSPRSKTHRVKSFFGGTAKHGVEQNCAPSICPSPRGSSSIIGLFRRPLYFNGKGQAMETSKALFHRGLARNQFGFPAAGKQIVVYEDGSALLFDCLSLSVRTGVCFFSYSTHCWDKPS
ncbi:hypothetical protein MUK42_23235 [Musa troglodytarum]|uniref:Uncharacterized protein n=1 Tax=Musa troglodytarum TaxID=320322 RepID=A0A9E7EVL2_9LILI|nr:hypothetical protein MUK42_23235 [Musa troglodytarum]